MSHQPQKSFWKRKGLKLPGSVSIVPSWSTSSNNSNSDSNDAEPVVIGARYTFTSLVTSHDSLSKNTALLPSQYASSKKQQQKHSKSQSTSHSSQQLQQQQQQKEQRQKSTAHQRSTSHPKSFNAFLKDTNDEWSDDIIGSTATTIVKQRESKQDPTIDQEALEKASKVAEAVLKVRSPTLTTTSTTSSVNKKHNPTNPNGIKDHVQDILQDPTRSLQWLNIEETIDPPRTKKFAEVMNVSNVDLTALRRLSWSGIPEELRMMAWQLLLGYLPCNSARREMTLARKRKEYADSVTATYARGTSGLDQALWHQIHIDIPRTNPGIPLYQCEATQLCLERILYQWAIRHPASGYVQGINDLVTPIFEVFLSAYIDEDPEQYDISQLDKDILSVMEADSFWCLSKLLDGIQDNYTFAQPGIQRQISTLKELVSRIDARLALHLQNEGIEFIQFAFRWMNCLLMRELPLRSTIRMWDTYLAEGSSEGFSEFHVYVCAAFLVKWSLQLQKLDFQGVMIFLQELPTQGWQEKDVELLLSEAYMWKTLFHNAPSHLK